jgi:hypothetical protein
MSDAIEAWLDRNNAFLGAELADLRRRLKALAPETPGAPPPPPSMVGRAARLRLLLQRRRAAADLPLLMSPDASARAAAAADQSADGPEEPDAPPALIMLGRRLGLSRFEREILFLCVAAELDTGIGGAFAEAQGDPQRTYPTFALAMILFEDPAWEALSPEAPLRRWRLIEIHQAGTTPLTQAALRADERIVNYVKGLNQLDDRLAGLLAPLDAVPLQSLPASQRSVAERLVRRGGEAAARLALLGSDAGAKRRIAAAVAGALGLNPYRLAAEAIPLGAELEVAAKLWARDGRLLPLALLIETNDAEPAGPGDNVESRVRAFARAAGGLVFVASRGGVPGLDADLEVDVARPAASEQREIWAEALGAPADSDLPAMLATQFDLGQAEIEAIAAEARDERGDEGLGARAWKASLARTRPAISRLAHRIDPKARWDDLVLPETETIGAIASE